MAIQAKPTLAIYAGTPARSRKEPPPTPGGQAFLNVLRAQCLQHRASLLLLLTVLLLAGCGRLDVNVGPLLRDVSVAPDQISPNADGDSDVTEIRYTLSRSAYVSIFFENEDGKRFYFRKDSRRSPDNYAVQWGGVMSDPTTETCAGRTVETWRMQIFSLSLATTETCTSRTVEILSQVLADGIYRWVVQATDDRDVTETKTGTITLHNGDTEMPKLANFKVSPQTFSPNQDGRDDWVSIDYYLTKDVEFVQVYLLDPQKPGVKFHIPEDPNTIDPEEKGDHSYRYEGGVNLNAEPPEDGTYQVIGEVQDRAGNRMRVTSTLTIEEGGKPRADIVQGEINWMGWREETNRVVNLSLGQTLCFSAIVRNEGTVPIRTIGPWPGQEYRFEQNFNTLAAMDLDGDGDTEWEWFQQPGAWRFGINFTTTGYSFPYRWAIGHKEELERRMIHGREEWYLLPGKAGTVNGCIVIDKEPPGSTVLWWGGLLHEAYGVPNEYIDRITVEIFKP